MVDNKSAYLKTQVLTARPEQLTLMLYDGALRFAEKARGCLAERNFEGSYEALTRAEQIVMELLNSLRPDVSPELCNRQSGLFLFVYQKLVEANLRRETPPLDDAVRVLETLRETWLLLMKNLQQHQAAHPEAEPPPVNQPALSIHG